MTVRELVVKLGFDVNSSDLKKYEKSVANVKSSMLALSATVTAAAGSLFAIAKTTANHGEEADKLSQRLGITTDAYQELAYAANLADIGSEELNQTMGILVRNIGLARSGSKEASSGFAAIGGEVAALVRGGASADQVLLSISDRFKNIQDPAKKAALAQQVFGRSGARMIPFLNKGSAELKTAFERAKAYGLVLDQETIDASNEFNDGIKELTAQASGLKNIIGSGLVKSMAPLIKQMIAWVDANRDFLKQGLTNFISGLVEVVTTAFSIFKKLASLIMTLVTPLGGLGNAIKYVVAGFAIFKSLQLVTALGELAIFAVKLARGFSLASAAGALMNAQALLIPLLIGAGIAFLLLAIEDIIGFFNGKDSVTGIIVEKFKYAFAYVVEFAKAMVTDIIDWFASLPAKLAPIFSFLSELFLMTPLGQLLSLLFKGGKAVFDFAKLLAPTDIPVQGALPGTGVANQKTLNNSINAPMTFNMGQGSDQRPEAIGTSVYNNLDELLRTSSSNLSSGVAY